MAIPKRYKRDLKKAYENSKSSSESGSRQKRKRKWMFVKGDLVRETGSDIWGIVISSPITESGLMTVMTSSGKKRLYASRLVRVQSTEK